MTVALVVFFIAVAFLAMSGFSFRFRALMNKKAWDGMAIPFGIIGSILFVIALVLIYIYYPR